VYWYCYRWKFDCEPVNWAMCRELEPTIGKFTLVDSSPQITGGLCCIDIWCSKDPMVRWNVLVLKLVGG
jgi:hypothetical protein